MEMCRWHWAALCCCSPGNRTDTSQGKDKERLKCLCCVTSDTGNVNVNPAFAVVLFCLFVFFLNSPFPEIKRSVCTCHKLIWMCHHLFWPGGCRVIWLLDNLNQQDCHFSLAISILFKECQQCYWEFSFYFQQNEKKRILFYFYLFIYFYIFIHLSIFVCFCIPPPLSSGLNDVRKLK